MRKPIDYTVYQTYSTTDSKWWTVYQFYPEGKWDENNMTLDEALVAYPKDMYDWNLGSMDSTLDDVFEDLIRIRDECDWGGIDKLLREYGM